MNSVETTKLNAALERLLLAVPKRGGNAVLQNVRWSVKDRLNLTATDLDNMVQVTIPVKTIAESDGLDVLIPADILSQVLKGELSQAVEFAASDGKFEVRAGKQVIVLPCSKADGFPLPPVGEKIVARLLASALRGAIAKTLFCVSTDQSRYTLNALRLEIHNSLFRLVATDGHRLSVVEGAAKADVAAGPCTLVTRVTARLLERLLAKTGDGWIEYSASSSDADNPFDFFALPDGTRLMGRRGQGQFPNYEAVMPRAPVEATVIFRREELIQGLEKLRPVAIKQSNHSVAFDFSNSRAVVKAEADGTHAQAELGHTCVSGKPRTISFDHNYLTQYAKSLEAETISMRLFPQTLCEAMMFDSFRYRHVLMPLRT